MIERRLQVIQELREAYNEALTDVQEAIESLDVLAAQSAARRRDFAYYAFQRAVEAYESSRSV